MRNTLLLMSVLAISCASIAETNQGSWANLGKLTPGQRIQIVEVTKKKHSGALVSASDSAISFSDAEGEKSIQKQDVHSVSLVGSNHRLRHILIGAGVGTGAGAGVGAGIAGSLSFLGGSGPKGKGAALGAGLGGVIGVIVGVLLPAHDTAIYTVSSR